MHAEKLQYQVDLLAAHERNVSSVYDTVGMQYLLRRYYSSLLEEVFLLDEQ